MFSFWNGKGASVLHCQSNLLVIKDFQPPLQLVILVDVNRLETQKVGVIQSSFCSWLRQTKRCAFGGLALFQITVCVKVISFGEQRNVVLCNA